MKRLIVTRADADIKDMSDLTHPIIKEYAKKCKADFKVLDGESECKDGHGKWHYRIMEVGDLLKYYDRILNIDTDVVINKNCEDIFEVCKHDDIACVFEDRGTRLEDRHQRIKTIQEKYGNVNWKWGYINNGFFLVSKKHKPIFQKINNEFWTGKGYDDAHLGWQIHKNNFIIYELIYIWNHMSMFSERWNGSPSRFHSHIIHYAGQGNFIDKKNRSRVQLIADDIANIYG